MTESSLMSLLQNSLVSEFMPQLNITKVDSNPIWNGKLGH
jgi:hypothetical protein